MATGIRASQITSGSWKSCGRGTSATNVLNNIAAALKAGYVVVASTVLTPTPADYVIGSHCYTVELVKFVKGKPVSIRLRNPWGVSGPGVNNSPSAYGTLSTAQFYNDFDTTSEGSL